MTLATEYLREYHLFVNDLPLFLLLLWICHAPGNSAGWWEVYRLWLHITEFSAAFCVDSSAKLMAERMLTFVCPIMSSGSSWSYLLLVASGRIPCHCESQKGEQNLLSLFLLSVIVCTWKSTQDYFRRKVLCTCVTPDSDLFLFLWYGSRSLNWSDQWKMLFEL